MKSIYFSFSIFLSLSLNVTIAQTHSVEDFQPKEKCIIKAKVVDQETGEELPFASIFLEKENKGMTTDLDGMFTMEVEDCQNAILEFSYVGFKSIKLNVTEIDEVVKLRTLTEDEWWEEMSKRIYIACYKN